MSRKVQITVRINEEAHIKLRQIIEELPPEAGFVSLSDVVNVVLCVETGTKETNSRDRRCMSCFESETVVTSTARMVNNPKTGRVEFQSKEKGQLFKLNNVHYDGLCTDCLEKLTKTVIPRPKENDDCLLCGRTEELSDYLFRLPDNVGGICNYCFNNTLKNTFSKAERDEEE